MIRSSGSEIAEDRAWWPGYPPVWLISSGTDEAALETGGAYGSFMRAAAADAPRGATVGKSSAGRTTAGRFAYRALLKVARSTTGSSTAVSEADVLAGVVPCGTPPSDGSTDEEEPRGGGLGIFETVDSAAMRLRGVSAQDLRLPQAANKMCEGVLHGSLAKTKWPHTKRDIRHDLSNVGSTGGDDCIRLGMKLRARS